MFRMVAFLWLAVRERPRPLLRCLMFELYSSLVSAAFHRVFLDHEELAVVARLEPHSELQLMLVEESRDLRKRFLTEVLDPEHLLFRTLNEIAQRLDVFFLQRVSGSDTQLCQIFDRTIEQIAQPLRHLNRARNGHLRHPTLSEVEHELEMLTNQRGRILDRRFRVQRPVPSRPPA